MNEQRKMLAETVERLFPAIAAQQRDHSGAAGFATAWARVEELGIADVLVAEDAGGFGGDWEDAYVVMRAAGFHALPLPVGEALVARALLAGTTIVAPAQTAITIAPCAGVIAGDGVLNLRLKGVGWGAGETCVLTAFSHAGVEYLGLFDCAAADDCRARDSAASAPRADLVLGEAALLASCRHDGAVAELFAVGALLRAAQMAGALEAALAQTIAHVNERQQFGRPLARFQVIQHQVALLAEEAAALACAAQAACAAADRGDVAFAIAAAKLRANRSVPQATSIAHQLHGAIGFTREHALHHLTQRLWAWQADFGNDRHWSSHLGRLVVRNGAANLWPRITA